MKKLILIITLLLFAGKALGQNYFIPSPSIISVTLVNGTIEVVYKRVNTVQWSNSPADYEVWKDIYKAQHETGKIILWAKEEGRYIQPGTIPERYEFDGELKIYDKSADTIYYRPNKMSVAGKAELAEMRVITQIGLTKIRDKKVGE